MDLQGIKIYDLDRWNMNSFGVQVRLVFWVEGNCGLTPTNAEGTYGSISVDSRFCFLLKKQTDTQNS